MEKKEQSREQLGSATRQVELIVKLFAIIQELSKETEMSIKQLSRNTNISTVNVYRCLNTLCDLGYAYQNEKNEQYGLTLRLASVFTNVLNHYNIVQRAQPLLKRLATDVGEATHLAIREGGSIVYVAKEDSPHALRMHSRVGLMATIHSTALGKAILAYTPENIRTEIYKTIVLTKHTENTITKIEDLEKEILKVKERGYAEDREENQVHVICLAAPIFDYTQNVAAAISISSPAVRCTDEAVSNNIKTLKKIADELSHIMGHDNPISHK